MYWCPLSKTRVTHVTVATREEIKLMSHNMKLCERVVAARLTRKVVIIEQLYGFLPRRSTTGARLGLRLLMEKYRGGQKELRLCRSRESI